MAAETQPTVGTADEQRFMTDSNSRTAPRMEGRGDDAKGLTRAAHLIEQRYKSLGLQPAGKNGFFQPFDVITGRHLRSGNRLQEAPLEDVSADRRNYKLLEEFIPLSFSANGSVDAPLVFAGYGITAPELSYDDYQGLDAKGKIVLALRGEPGALSAKSTEGGHTPHEWVISKAINAKNHGATAIIVVNGKLPNGEEDVLPRLGDAEVPEDPGILHLQVKNSTADNWLRNQGMTLSEVQTEAAGAIHAAGSLSSTSTRLILSLTVDIERIHATVNNVLA